MLRYSLAGRAQQQHAKAVGAVPPDAAREHIGETHGVGNLQRAVKCYLRPIGPGRAARHAGSTKSGHAGGGQIELRCPGQPLAEPIELDRLSGGFLGFRGQARLFAQDIDQKRINLRALGETSERGIQSAHRAGV